MLRKFTHSLTVLAAKKLLDTDKTKNLSTAKRMVSIVAGAYIFQRGVKSIVKHPLIGLQETFLGGFLIYDAVRSIRQSYPVKPTEISEVRRNQIQGNDPNSSIPAFV